MMLPSHDVVTPLTAEARYIGRLAWMNECEASVVEVIPFFLLLATSIVSARVRTALAAVVRRNAGTAFVALLLTAWMLLPLPEWFGTITLMRWSPGSRTLFPFGVAIAILGVSLLAELATAEPRHPLPWSEIAFGLLAFLAVFLFGREHLDPSVRTSWDARIPLLVAALSSAAGLFVLHDRRGPFVLAAGWALSLFIVNVKVNPLIRSRDLFFKGSGYAAIEQALAAEPGRIVDYQLHFGNTLAGHGLPSLASVQHAPDLGLYRFLTAGQSGTSEEIYNRYANTTFALPPQRTQLLNQDYLQVAISPCSRRLAALGVNHILVSAPTAIPPDCADAFKVISAGEVLLWSRKEPVCRFGIANGPRVPASAEDFDFSCGSSGDRARLQPGRFGFVIEAPAEADVHYAVAMNTSLVGTYSCVNASLETLDAHLIVSPSGAGPVRCSVSYFDSVDAIRRLLGNQSRSPVVNSGYSGRE
jgi:hypothetical protein